MRTSGLGHRCSVQVWSVLVRVSLVPVYGEIRCTSSTQDGVCESSDLQVGVPKPDFGLRVSATDSSTRFMVRGDE